MKEQLKKSLLEGGISFDYIKLQKTIGDVKKLSEEYRKQIKKLASERR